jgi:serine/threonine-protein phosphatase 2A regulatory subunit B''
LIPTLPQLNGIDPTFEPFYVCTAARKFFFFLDPQRKLKIRIVDILASGLIDDILDVRNIKAVS